MSELARHSPRQNHLLDALPTSDYERPAAAIRFRVTRKCQAAWQRINKCSSLRFDATAPST